MLASTFQALIVPSDAQPSHLPAANARNDQGVQLWQAGRRSEAVAAFDEAAHADSQFAVPWHNRGAIFLIEGQFAQAIPAFQRAIQLATMWTLPRTHLAQAYLRAGNAVAALEVSDAARALDPTLPDVRGDLRTLLQARLQVATVVAARRRTFFLITLVMAAFVTLLTAGLAFATLAVPIYRFTLLAQARMERDAVRQQLQALDARPAPVTNGVPLALPPAAAVGAGLSGGGTYVAAGTLPPYSAAELGARAPSGTGYRRAGWVLLALSVAGLAVGILELAQSLSLPQDPNQADVETLLGLGGLVLAALLCALAVLIGAVAALRRYRVGWAVGILVVGVLGIFVLIVPAQLMVLLYLVAMPHTPAERSLEFVPVSPVNLGDGKR